MIWRRILAYFIDILLVTFAASMLASISYLNPKLDKYNEIYEEYTKLIETDITEIDQDQLNDLNYKLEKNNIYGAIISITLTFAYFVVFQKYNDGQTLGKKLTKIKIEGNKSLISYLLRSLVLHNIFINGLKLILILNMSQAKYISISRILYVVELFIEVTILTMVLMREDKRGLHDLIADTKVVDANRGEEQCITA